jgi:site-specific DNA-methyltransferase (adenine-specific)
MIYEKSWAPYPALVRYNQIWEYMFVFSKGKPKTINLIKDKPNVTAGCGIDRPGGFRKKDGRTKPSSKSKDGKPKYIGEFGVRGNIWRYPVGKMVSSKDRIAFGHPAIFPEDLAKDHILSWSNPGDLILDPMCGSGTVPKQCKILGRNYIGIEIVKDYYDIALERIEKSIDLFSI